MAESLIIKPPKKRKLADPFIAPIGGDWGPCQLCGHQSKLTENHIPPESVGNCDRWQAQSYMTALGADKDLYFGRNFHGGVRFKTLCAGCNSGLGGREDKEIAAFFTGARKLVETQLILGRIGRLTAKPNLLYRGLLAHVISANDSGVPTPFDKEGRDVFFKRTQIGLSTWSLFYWLYVSEPMFLMRHVYHMTWSPTVEVKPMHLLKFYPLAFMFTQQPWFYGLPNMLRFVQRRDDDVIDLPIFLWRRDTDPLWPATTSDTNVIMTGGHSFGLVGVRT